MNRILAVGCVATLTLSLSGCGSNAESLVKEQIQTMNDLADALQKNDQARAGELNKKLEQLSQEFGKLSDSEKKAALEKHAEELKNATMKMMTVQMGQMTDMFKQGMGDMFKGGMPKIEFKGP